MNSACPASTDCAVTAAALIIGESALAGLSVTCTSEQITVQACECSGDPAGRAAQAGLPAGIAGPQACRHDSPLTACRQVKAYGQVRGIPVSIFTPVMVRTRPADTGPVPLAADPGGQVTAVPGGKLPPRWRRVTGLDPGPAGTAPGQEAP